MRCVRREELSAMPKSRRRKRKPKGTVLNLPPRAIEAVEHQRERFRQKFGRDWKDGDPVFFDPDADVPTPMSMVKIERRTREGALKHVNAAYDRLRPLTA
jgi:hypothetical protein